ncbi:hypothetical protein B296_00007517 [Ensete ventricosum]|uniref:Tf2-1-like SH3-like domain-containing protein n=1 Tax=Ensete ventricosum TaxID=4639 RepID=A0A426ZWI7_ENSVE|nr:hypothetical protein B296_00007517 [Ensete ventricosum]
MFQKVVARLYNRRVRLQPIGDGDLVLKKTEVSNPGHTRVKLDPNWEGPYRVVCTIRDKTYVMSIMDDRVLPRTWHISNLKKFYI